MGTRTPREKRKSSPRTNRSLQAALSLPNNQTVFPPLSPFVSMVRLEGTYYVIIEGAV